MSARQEAGGCAGGGPARGGELLALGLALALWLGARSRAKRTQVAR